MEKKIPQEKLIMAKETILKKINISFTFFKFW